MTEFTECFDDVSHLIQRGLADREVMDLKNSLVGLQLVKDGRHATGGNGHVILHHVGMMILYERKQYSFKHNQSIQMHKPMHIFLKKKSKKRM